MKKLLVTALILVSTVGRANEIEGIRNVNAVRVNSVTATQVGEFGFPSTEVKVQATFGNSCQVPNSDELVSIVNYSKNFDQLIISLGNQSERMCPMVFMPVTVTINVGTFTRPNDGMFSKITVNQVVAR